MAEDRSERARAIEAALAQIDKQFGKGSIMRLGSREKVDVPAIPTGSLSLDAALGVGGMPARPGHRDLRPGVLGQDHPGPARHRRGPAARRHGRLHRRRARPGRDLRRASWASTPTTCWSPSPTAASRPWRSPRS